MTKKEFIASLDFEAAKKEIARKIGMKPNSFTINTKPNGAFNIDLKKTDTKLTNFIFGAMRKASIASDSLDVTDNSYKATIAFVSGTKTLIGELRSNGKNWELLTNKEVVEANKLATRAAAKEEKKALRAAKKLEKAASTKMPNTAVAA